MLCINLFDRTRACTKVTGGVSDLILFDPEDFNFTQATVSGKKGPYTAVAARTGATGQLMFPVTFNYQEGELTVKQTLTNNSSSYTHEFVGQLAEIDQSLANLLESIDEAGICCGLGAAVRYNNGKIFIAGEKYVNSSAIPRFLMRQSGSDGSSGKVFTDLNGYNLHISGDYSRPLYEYTGDYSTLEAFMGGTVTPVTYNTPLAASASVFDSTNNVYTNSDTASGLTMTTATADANQEFQIDAVNPHTGLPAAIEIFVGGVQEAVVDGTVDYVNKTFRYKDKAGVWHENGVWAAAVAPAQRGVVNF